MLVADVWHGNQQAFCEGQNRATNEDKRMRGKQTACGSGRMSVGRSVSAASCWTTLVSGLIGLILPATTSEPHARSESCLQSPHKQLVVGYRLVRSMLRCVLDASRELLGRRLGGGVKSRASRVTSVGLPGGVSLRFSAWTLRTRECDTTAPLLCAVRSHACRTKCRSDNHGVR